jgi:hypothetical protein
MAAGLIRLQSRLAGGFRPFVCLLPAENQAKDPELELTKAVLGLSCAVAETEDELKPPTGNAFGSLEGDRKVAVGFRVGPLTLGGNISGLGGLSEVAK